MRKFNWLAVAILTVTFAGCASKPDKPEVPPCAFPDDGATPAPDWVCGAPYKDLKIFAVGSYEKTGAGFDFQKTMAAASARDFLARQARVQVQNMVKRYAETTGSGDAETIDRVNSSISKQITKEDLSGTRIYITRTNPATKTLYVLVGMDAALSQEFAKQQLRSSMNNEKALWQKFQAKKSFDEMAEEMSKLQ